MVDGVGRGRGLEYCLFRAKTSDSSARPRINFTAALDIYERQRAGADMARCFYASSVGREREKEEERGRTENFDEMQSHGGVNI